MKHIKNLQLKIWVVLLLLIFCLFLLKTLYSHFIYSSYSKNPDVTFYSKHISSILNDIPSATHIRHENYFHHHSGRHLFIDEISVDVDLETLKEFITNQLNSKRKDFYLVEHENIELISHHANLKEFIESISINLSVYKLKEIDINIIENIKSKITKDQIKILYFYIAFDHQKEMKLNIIHDSNLNKIYAITLSD